MNRGSAAHKGICNVSPNGVFGNEVYGGDSEGFGVNPSSDEFRLCNSDEWRFINGGGPLEICSYGGGGDMEKVCVITTLKFDLRKFKGKDIVDIVAQVSNATTIAPGMYKLDPVTLAPMDKNNRETHIYYLKHTMEQAAILREILEQSKSLNPLDSVSYSTCKYVKLIQELLGYVRETCPDIHKPSEKLVGVTPINKKKIIRFAEPDIPSSTSQKQLGSSQTKTKQTTNNSVLTSTGVRRSTKSSSSMFDARHELCFLEFVSNMNASSKSKSVKKTKKKEEWKPTRKVFTKIGYNWRPIGRTFTLVENACPLTRITTTNKVPLREPIPLEVVAQESIVTKVYTRRPKVVQIVLWYLDSGCSKHMTEDRSQLTNFVHKFLDTVKFSNNQIAKIMGYGDYQIGNIKISRVCYVEGLGHNLFSNGQLCDSDLEVAFRKHMCFVRNLEGVDLLSGSQETNLYALPMQVASTNGKKYILVIMDDYSRFTWMKFLATKDEAPDFIIMFLKTIQVRLNAPVKINRTYNGTEFVNQTLRSYYESVGISHETSVAPSPQQNGFVKRRNRTLVKAARTMLIYAKAPLFLWAEAVATACYTQNRSIIRVDLGKLQAKADIGIFIGYVPKKKAYRIYNRRT
ncbi:integrase, catalytic region, zinc finger, CCHC-type containing protein [Tanacetum coccineum]